MYEFFATIFVLFLLGGMCYALYQHFASPFKTISNIKKIKETSNKIENIITDETFKKRIEPANIALKEGKLTQEKYEIIFKELILERLNELYGNDNNSTKNIIEKSNIIKNNISNNNVNFNKISNKEESDNEINQEIIKKENITIYNQNNNSANNENIYNIENSNNNKNNSNNINFKPITIISSILIAIVLCCLIGLAIGYMLFLNKINNNNKNDIFPTTTTTTTTTTTKKIITTTKPPITTQPTTTPTTQTTTSTTTTTTTTTQPATQPITNIKSKLIEELEFEGYKKDSNNENYYTLINEYPINIEGVPTLCIFVTSFNLRHYSYGYTLQCYQNNIMFYEQHTDYYSKTNKSSFKSLTSLEEIFDTTLAEIDNNNVFTCEGTNCEHGKQSMEQNKNNFITILNNANITQEELN